MSNKHIESEITEYINPSSEEGLVHKEAIKVMEEQDTAKFMQRAGAGFVAKQYQEISNTSKLAAELEKRMFEKANKDDADLEVIMRVHSQLTRKADNQARNVLKLYAGNNNDASPLLKKSDTPNDNISNASNNASAKDLDTMSTMALVMQALVQQNQNLAKNNSDTEEEK